MAYGGRRTCSLALEDLWGGRIAAARSSRSHWGLSLGWCQHSGEHRMPDLQMQGKG